jgi:hypothetical protein
MVQHHLPSICDGRVLFCKIPIGKLVGYLHWRVMLSHIRSIIRVANMVERLQTRLVAAHCRQPQRYNSSIFATRTMLILKALHYLGITNAVVCCLLVVIYIQSYARPKYFTPKWETSVQYNKTLYPPAFAYLGGGNYTDAALVDFVGTHLKCTFPTWKNDTSNDCPPAAFNDSQISLNVSSPTYQYMQSYIFDPRGLPTTRNNMSDLSQRVLLQVNVNCKSLLRVYKVESF